MTTWIDRHKLDRIAYRNSFAGFAKHRPVVAVIRNTDPETGERIDDTGTNLTDTVVLLRPGNEIDEILEIGRASCRERV